MCKYKTLVHEVRTGFGEPALVNLSCRFCRQSITWCWRLSGTLWSRRSVDPMLTSPQTTWFISTGSWWATSFLRSSTTCSWDCLDKNHSKRLQNSAPWSYTYTPLSTHLSTHLITFEHLHSPEDMVTDVVSIVDSKVLLLMEVLLLVPVWVLV